MRPYSFAVAISFVLACASPPPVVPGNIVPSDAPLDVRLHQPIGDVIHYSLSEPAYVALFAVTRGQGVRLVFPYFESQVAHRGHAGLNQETVHGGSRSWGYAGGLPSDQRELRSRLIGSTDAYFIIASKEPLPLEGILQSPYLLRSLLGEDAYRATNFSRTWSALANVLVAGMPAEAWSLDVYLTLRAPYIFSVAYAQEPTFTYCGDGRRSFYAPGLAFDEWCGSKLTLVATTPPVPGPAPTFPMRKPPAEPRDRDPSVPLPPDGGIIATSRSGRDTFGRDRVSRDGESGRSEMGRADWKRGEPARAPERQVDAIRQRASEPQQARPAETRPQAEPSRPAENRPQQEPSRAETKRPDPQPGD